MPWLCCSPLTVAAFQHATDRSNEPPNHASLSDFSIPPEPESRYGLSLAHNDACATIARSTFLACTFVSHTGNPRESVPSLAPSLRSVSRPNRGDFYARNPLSAPISSVPDLSPISTPLQALFQRPSGSKRSTGPISESSSHRTFDC